MSSPPWVQSAELSFNIGQVDAEVFGRETGFGARRYPGNKNSQRRGLSGFAVAAPSRVAWKIRQDRNTSRRAARSWPTGE